MQLKRFFSCPNNILQGACLASNGYIYLSFWGQGLFCYEKTGKLIKQYTSNNSGLTNNYVLDIIEKKGYLWLATDGGGINRLELRNEKFSNLYHIAGDENSLPVNSITVLYRIATNVYGREVLEEEFSISKKVTYVLIKTVL